MALEAHRDQYDVAVVGAGIAGCTVATLYARHGLRVALIETKTDANGVSMCQIASV